MQGSAKQFIEKQLGIGIVSFSMDALTKATGLSEIAAKNQLLRLGELVVRVTPRQSYFLIVTPEHRMMGAPPVDLWLDDYFTWLGRPYYVALQSAAAMHGASPQAVQETQVITDAPIRNIRFSRVRLSFFTKSHIAKSLTQQVPNAAAPLKVSTPETTALDLVRYAGSLGGIERAAETIQPMLPLMRVGELRKTLAAENELASAQRLGFIFKHAGADKLAKAVADWLPKTKKNVPLALGITAERDMPVETTFNVIINAMRVI
ncbi:hypothetical protein ED236_09485 [Pseudomethylobacillus aquaticus]|uniref:AbiEi antitoxin C-terminal domain-containing protein n=1 Tax=Pseudomethylobacillus aquaticus TaxID=2676064 RepID=A0A3N0UY24_9PROT|nr:type IV toxin-antitoxin system AbiEi family antitoxin [Pseudomethylobacillus aquaticus]ROH85420.1 hypothetical protein ED236_09485 [Pseudomethylobacillus aquaticus]